MTYTTKRHTELANRFRLLIPINYKLLLDQEDYKEFMQGIINWLPFKVDESANQRSRKWSTFNGAYHYNDGVLFDALKFIPKTSKNEIYKQNYQQIENLDNLERWFAQKMVNGNRNNQMIKFALALVDSGLTFAEIESRVFRFNKQLSNGLTEDELRSSVLITVARKLHPQHV